MCYKIFNNSVKCSIFPQNAVKCKIPTESLKIQGNLLIFNRLPLFIQWVFTTFLLHLPVFLQLIRAYDGYITRTY